MADPQELLRYNADWASELARDHPELLERMAAGQAPEYLWLGCADSRVPPHLALGLGPGELFVHRNVGNLAPADDPAVQATVAFAAGTLGVRHIIVAGHTDCGAAKTALQADPKTLPADLAHWLTPLRDLAASHQDELAALPADQRPDALARRNVAEQVRLLAASEAVTGAWRAGQSLAVHGWLYHVADATIEDLAVTVSGP